MPMTKTDQTVKQDKSFKDGLALKLEGLKEEYLRLSSDFIKAKEHYEDFYRDYEAPQKERFARAVNNLDLYRITPAHKIEDKLNSFGMQEEDYIRNMTPEDKEYVRYYSDSYRKHFFGGQEMIDLFGEYWTADDGSDNFVVGDSYFTEYEEPDSFDLQNLYTYPQDDLKEFWDTTVFGYAPKTLQNAFILPCCISDVEVAKKMAGVKSNPAVTRRRFRVEDYDLLSMASDKYQIDDPNPERIFPFYKEDSGARFRYKRFLTSQNAYMVKKKGIPHNLKDLILLLKKRETDLKAPERIYSTIALCSSIEKEEGTMTLFFKDPTKEISLDFPLSKTLAELEGKICAVSFYFPENSEEFYPLCIQASNIGLHTTDLNEKTVKTTLIDLRKRV